ncbi:hypothetical protein [Tahibacter soli]|uniref:Uncharacterized protein n=1 Tax=Tahibacter soli TaxID=2983605 RepID=A0A9X4BHH1_9GAMM|nr:hypothetical protein [Tahibacter soli]MDC8014145.1 hypothetical protein [Tahibacter soli]
MHYLARIDAADEGDVFHAGLQIDGWRYAYLRSVEKSRRRLLRGGRPFDATLFVVEADRRRRYVARLAGVECLHESHALAARAALAQYGWLATHGDGAVPADGAAFNVRFRFGDIRRYPSDAFAAEDDVVMRLHRYQLHGVGEDIGPAPPRSPEHAAMRRRLVDQLRAAHPHARIDFDTADADVLLRDHDTTYAFQIRTELDPRTALRRSLDRLVRHYLSDLDETPALRLVVVVRKEPDAADLRYLSLLRGLLGLPIACRVVAVDPPAGVGQRVGPAGARL